MALSVLPPPSLTYQSTALMAWIWYGPPMGSRFCSRTQNESRDAGWATMLSATSCSSRAFTIGVPRSWLNITTSPLISLYFWTGRGRVVGRVFDDQLDLVLASHPAQLLVDVVRIGAIAVGQWLADDRHRPAGRRDHPEPMVSPSKPGTASGAPPPRPRRRRAASSSSSRPPHAVATSAMAAKPVSSRSHACRFSMSPPVAVGGVGSSGPSRKSSWSAD